MERENGMPVNTPPKADGYYCLSDEDEEVETPAVLREDTLPVADDELAEYLYSPVLSLLINHCADTSFPALAPYNFIAIRAVARCRPATKNPRHGSGGCLFSQRRRDGRFGISAGEVGASD